jgi:hypothetical protein
VETFGRKAERTWFAIREGEAHAEPVAVAGDCVGEKFLSYKVFCRCRRDVGRDRAWRFVRFRIHNFRKEISAPWQINFRNSPIGFSLSRLPQLAS